MKYNITPDLPKTGFDVEYSGEAPSSEFYPPAIVLEASQTLSENFELPKTQDKIKYIYSRSFKPYTLFKDTKWNLLDFSIINANHINSTKIVADTFYIDVINRISTGIILNTEYINSNNANLTSISSDSITCNTLNSNIAVITDLYGLSLDYDLAQFQHITATNTLRANSGDFYNLSAINGYFSDRVNTQRITATTHVSTARTIADAVKVVEMYNVQNSSNFTTGSIIQISNDPNNNDEIALASNILGNFGYGIVAENPACPYNHDIENSEISTAIVLGANTYDKTMYKVPVTLFGRTRVRVIKPVRKFDKIIIGTIVLDPNTTVSSTNGIGIARREISSTNWDNEYIVPSGCSQHRSDNLRPIVGIALEDNNSSDEKLVECIVKFFM